MGATVDFLFADHEDHEREPVDEDAFTRADATVHGLRDELEVAGKKMPVARWLNGCPSNQCRRGNPNAELPYIRFCWGICPVGKRGIANEIPTDVN